MTKITRDELFTIVLAEYMASKITDDSGYESHYYDMGIHEIEDIANNSSNDFDQKVANAAQLSIMKELDDDQDDDYVKEVVLDGIEEYFREYLK